MSLIHSKTYPRALSAYSKLLLSLGGGAHASMLLRHDTFAFECHFDLVLSKSSFTSKRIRLEGKAQLVKCLLQKQEDLSLYAWHSGGR